VRQSGSVRKRCKLSGRSSKEKLRDGDHGISIEIGQGGAGFERCAGARVERNLLG
jgi:hypothetical protein